jgi:hypothetical protein
MEIVPVVSTAIGAEAHVVSAAIGAEEEDVDEEIVVDTPPAQVS